MFTIDDLNLLVLWFSSGADTVLQRDIHKVQSENDLRINFIELAGVYQKHEITAPRSCHTSSYLHSKLKSMQFFCCFFYLIIKIFTFKEMRGYLTTLYY